MRADHPHVAQPNDGGPGCERAKDAAASAALPFVTAIPVRSYLDYAFPLSILAAVSDAYRVELFGSFIQMFVPERKEAYDRVLMVPALRTNDWCRLGHLEVESLDVETFGDGAGDALKRRVVDSISDGWYIEIHLDEYHLPSRPSYGQHHSVHDNMIIGYDEDTATVTVAGYGRDYETTEVSWSNVHRAFFRVPRAEAHKRLVRRIRGIRGKQARLNVPAVMSQLGDYVAGRVSLDESSMRREPQYRRCRRYAGTWGVQTYDVLTAYWSNAVRRGDDVDLRSTRTFWEHKALMLDRLSYLERSSCVKAVGLAQQYAPVEQLARRVRFDAFEYMATGRQANALADVATPMRLMRQVEERVLLGLLKSLGDAQPAN
jgi:hypothetical protein